MRLKIPDGRKGRRTFYARLRIGRRWLFVQRWDTERAPNNRFLSRDRVMGWTWGARDASLR